MAYIMPLFALTGLYWPFGLVLYWVTTNLWTLGQQYVLFKRYPMPTPVGAGPAAAAAGKAAPVQGFRPGRAARAQEGARRAAEASRPGGPAAGLRPTGRGRPGMLRRLSKGRAEPEPPAGRAGD